MANSMKWKNLLSTSRLGTQSPGEGMGRTHFQRDFDRIIFSTAFRRLQSKTQVFPLPETDFIHTRLTHSLETSSVGRSLGQLVQENLFKTDDFKKENVEPFALSSVVAAATIAHDIGNPPFGHSGEEAISDWFLNGAGQDLIKDLSEAQQNDLCHFEGNAMGFRILTHTLKGKSKRAGGLGITKGTLAAFTKYPCESSEGNRKGATIAQKKYGFFSSEKQLFEEVATETGLLRTENRYLWHRSPLAFLVEAADDICYLMMDLEDGYRLGIIPFKSIEELYMEIIGSDLDNSRYGEIVDSDEKVGYLRAKAINSLVREVTVSFVDNYKAIMEGRFDSSLTKTTENVISLDNIRIISREKIYNYRKVREIETAGFEVIYGLLEGFIPALLGHSNSKKSEKIIQLITPSYLETPLETPDSKYSSIMSVLQFIAGMTDRFAIDTYRIIKGISLPHY